MLSNEEIELIKSSWLFIKKQKKKLSQVHYDKLFELAPDTKELFKSGVDIQGKRFIISINKVITNYENHEDVETYLKRLGLLHKSFKTKPSHYLVMISALHWGLFEILKDNYTDDLRLVWDKFFKEISNLMILGSKGK